MAHALTNTQSAFGFSAALSQFVENWKTLRAERAIYNQTFGELSKLGDRELADIGVARSDIAEIARQSVILSR